MNPRIRLRTLLIVVAASAAALAALKYPNWIILVFTMVITSGAIGLMLWSHRRWFAVGFLVFGAIMYTAVLFTPLSKPYMTGVERIFLTLHRDRAWWLADGTPQPTALTRPATIDFAVFFFTCVVIVSLLAGALGGGAVCLFLRSWGRDERPVSLNQAFGGASALHGEPAEGLET